MNSSENKVATLTFQTFLLRRADAEALVSSKGLTFGGAGASLAIILLIAQIGVTKTAISLSLCFAAVAFPLWISLALTYDIWLSLKLDVNDLHAVRWLPKLQALWFHSTGAITFASIAFLVFGLHTNIGFAFLTASLLGLTFVVVALLSASRRLLHHMTHTGGEGAQNNGA